MTESGRGTGDDRRNQILDTAQELFAHYGFDKTSMSEIAEAASVSRTIVYRHFSGKDEMFAAVCSRVFEAFMDEVESATKTAGPIEQRIHAVLGTKRIFLQLAGSGRHGIDLLERGSSSYPDLASQSVERIESATARLLRDAARIGEIDLGGSTAKMAARIIYLAYDGAWKSALEQGADVQAFEKESKALLALLMRGLRPR